MIGSTGRNASVNERGDRGSELTIDSSRPLATLPLGRVSAREVDLMGKHRINKRKPVRTGETITVGKAGSVPPGRGATVKLKDGTELALYNIGGTFHAIENFCPHKGYPLADSRLYGSIVECDLHGWRFDVRSGECFTDRRCSIERYEVKIEDGWIRIIV